MQWVTRDHVHLDRVAAAWLIRRRIDLAAEILFVPGGSEWPANATAFGLPGAELGPHDASGTTFEKIVRKYQLNDPALDLMGAVIASGVHHALHRGQPDEFDVPHVEGIGLDAISEGQMLLAKSDEDNIDTSMRLYDALYAYCRAAVLTRENPAYAQMGFMQRFAALKEAGAAAPPAL